MAAKKKKNTTKSKSQQPETKSSDTLLDKYTDEELEDFIRKRRIRNITPNLDSQIALMVEIIDKAEKLEEHPFRQGAFDSKTEARLERYFIVYCKDYYSRLLREKQSIENRPQ